MHFQGQRVVAALIALVIVFGLPLVDATPSHAGITVAASPARPIAGERVRLTGRFGSSVARPVRLQYWTGSRWAVLAKKKTTSTGRFVFTPRAKAPSRRFRVHAPRFRANGRVYRAAVSDPRRVRTVAQTARLTFLPAPVGQARTDPSRSNLTPGTATFRPIRKGRRVAFQRYANGAWRTIATSRQNGKGVATFQAQAATAFRHRAVTRAANGAPAKRSSAVKPTHLPRRFNDDFNANGLNLTKWSYRLPGSREGGGRACSESSSQSVKVENGRLVLTTRKIPQTDITAISKKTSAQCPHGQYYNGHIGTHGKFAFQHGIMAARIRVQPHRGHHGGFWSQPSHSPAYGAEIDAVEYYGNEYRHCSTCRKGPIQHSIYRENTLMAKVLNPRTHLLQSGRTWSQDYHIFSVQWTPTQYIFRIDGQVTFRTRKAVSKVDQYLILSLLSSDWEMKNLPSGPAPMYVDWVRVWAR